MQAVGKADEVFAVEADQGVGAVLLAPGTAEDFVRGQLAGVAFQHPLALADEFREGLFAEASGGLGEGNDAGFAEKEATPTKNKRHKLSLRTCCNH